MLTVSCARLATSLLSAVALSSLIVPCAAWADALIDNVNGITLDKDGKVVRFTGLLMSPDGKVVKLLDLYTILQGYEKRGINVCARLWHVAFGIHLARTELV